MSHDKQIINSDWKGPEGTISLTASPSRTTGRQADRQAGSSGGAGRRGPKKARGEGSTDIQGDCLLPSHL